MLRLYSRSRHPVQFALAALFILGATCAVRLVLADEVRKAGAVSFARQVEPILRANCQGCHQPAKAHGSYSMTTYAALLAIGDSGEAGIVPGSPDESELVRQITPRDGEANMPKDAPPLNAADIELIRQWIAEGAIDETPESKRLTTTISSEHPPNYVRPPVATSIDFSPDGKWLAVNGFHETILIDAATYQPTRRLVGLSERIQSATFSPDSTRLGVTGGSPGRFGEVQIWDVHSGELLLSRQITYDTLFGGSFSPDGKLLAFGATDRVVRAIDSQTGQQRLYQGAHEDWSLATVFNPSGTHLVSGGRDMSVKLTEVATERFVDNVTSITPGALKGGVSALAIHPTHDQILVGGADGTPKIYRIFRETERKIGDDANLIRKFPQMIGRIFSVSISADGSLFAVASTLDGSSQIKVYPFDFTGEMPDDVKAIHAKPVSDRNDDEKKRLAQWTAQTSPAVTQFDLSDSIYSAALHPSGKQLAVGGAEGVIRVYSIPEGQLLHEFVAVPIEQDSSTPDQHFAEKQALPAAASGLTAKATTLPDAQQESEKLPRSKLIEIVIKPKDIRLSDELDYVQLVVTARYADGQTADVTRLAKYRTHDSIISIDPLGLVRLSSLTGTDGDTLSVEFDGMQAAATIERTRSTASLVDFVRDVNPIISRLGCNAGTCHGAQQGKNGFQLSLRGYDPLGDVRALSDDLCARRLNTAAPDSSVMLLKPLGDIPHEGGMLLTSDSVYYRVLRDWIAQGAKYDPTSQKVQRIEVTPANSTIESEGAWQQFRVTAFYPDGSTRDVTHEAFLDSSNTEICESLPGARVRGLRRGEASLLVRYEGAYAAASITVMGDRSGFKWQAPETYNTIDQLVAEKWERMKILPSDISEDHVFLRRVRLDLTGLPPSVDELKEFLADPRPSRTKRQAKIDQLIGSEDYIVHWTNKWSDLLQVNSKFLGAEGAAAFRTWIRSAIAENAPYDQFVRSILTAKGSNKDNPAASYFKILRDPDLLVENTTHLFLGVRFNCNKCHDHPFERWTQTQYYELAAYFAQTGLKADPASGNQTIGGSAVEGAKPLYEEVFDKDAGEVTHIRTAQVTPPKFPFACDYQVSESASRREQLAAWITSKDNPYFATSMVNRLWGYLTGTGLIEPLDDIRAGNPPSNPKLLKHLTDEFTRTHYDIQHVLRMICNSRTYQLSIHTNSWNADDHWNNSHAKARRLPAEVLYDTVYRVTGSTSNIPGVAPGTRAAQLPDVAISPADGFLNNLGRPVRESACECERSDQLQLGPVMALVSGPTVATAIGDSESELASLCKHEVPLGSLVEEVYLRVLSRYPTQQEIAQVLALEGQIDADHRRLDSLLAERETWWKQRHAELDAQRLKELEQTREAARAREKEIAPERTRLEQERLARIDVAKKTLDQYAANPIEIANRFLASSGSNNHWFPLAAATAQASNGARLTSQPDRSIIVSKHEDKGTGKGNYTIAFQTPLRNIRGFRLEAILDASVPSGGPGFPGNGNFVVTEIEVHAASLAKPEEKTPQKIASGKADFSQAGFSPEETFDGNATDQNGWAVHPRGRIPHWATYQFAETIDREGGVELTFTIHQNHDAEDHRLARFRISLTTDEGEIHLGLPEEFSSLASINEEYRTPENLKSLVAFLDKSDAKWNELRAAVAAAEVPVPADEQLVALQNKVAELEKPVADDAKLLQLRANSATSQLQMANRRLTLAQDLTWALINSPAFLFNH